MPQLLRSRRSYDHRIREIVCQTGNPAIFQHLRTERQTAIIRLVVVLLKLSGFRVDQQRLPDGTAKARVLGAVDRGQARPAAWLATTASPRAP